MKQSTQYNHQTQEVQPLTFANSVHVSPLGEPLLTLRSFVALCERPSKDVRAFRRGKGLSALLTSYYEVHADVAPSRQGYLWANFYPLSVLLNSAPPSWPAKPKKVPDVSYLGYTSKVEPEPFVIQIPQPQPSHYSLQGYADLTNVSYGFVHKRTSKTSRKAAHIQTNFKGKLTYSPDYFFDIKDNIYASAFIEAYSLTAPPSVPAYSLPILTTSPCGIPLFAKEQFSKSLSKRIRAGHSLSAPSYTKEVYVEIKGKNVRANFYQASDLLPYLPKLHSTEIRVFLQAQPTSSTLRGLDFVTFPLLTSSMHLNGKDYYPTSYLETGLKLGSASLGRLFLQVPTPSSTVRGYYEHDYLLAALAASKRLAFRDLAERMKAVPTPKKPWAKPTITSKEDPTTAAHKAELAKIEADRMADALYLSETLTENYRQFEQITHLSKQLADKAVTRTYSDAELLDLCTATQPDHFQCTSAFTVIYARDSYKSMEGKTFRYCSETDTYTKIETPLPMATLYHAEAFRLIPDLPVDEIAQLYQLLARAAKEGGTLVLHSAVRSDFDNSQLYMGGRYIQGDADRSSRLFVDKEFGNRIQMIDTDDLQIPPETSPKDIKAQAEYALQAYANRFQITAPTTYIALASSSFGTGTTKIKLHIYWLSTKPMHRQEMHDRLQPYREALRNGVEPLKVCDPSIYSIGRKDWIFPPTFIYEQGEPAPDPMDTRIVLVRPTTPNSPTLLPNPSVPETYIEANAKQKAQAKTKRTKRAALTNAMVGDLPTSSDPTQSKNSFIASLSKKIINQMLWVGAIHRYITQQGAGVPELSDSAFRADLVAVVQRNYERPLTLAEARAKVLPQLDRDIASIKAGILVPFSAEEVTGPIERAISALSGEKVPMPFTIPLAHLPDEVNAAAHSPSYIPQGEYLGDLLEPTLMLKNAFNVVSASTGTGKTTLMTQSLINLAKTSPKTTSLIIIGSRSLAANLLSNINRAFEEAGMDRRYSSYLKNGKVRTGPELRQEEHLILSVQSLFKLGLGWAQKRNFDGFALIIEELNHTFSQFVNMTMTGGENPVFSKSLAVLSECLMYSTSFLGLDATLKQDILDFLTAKISAPSMNMQLHSYIQAKEAHRAAHGTEATFYRSEYNLLADLTKYLTENVDATGRLTVKVDLVLNSLTLANGLYLMLQREQRILKTDLHLLTGSNFDTESTAYAFGFNDKPGLLIRTPVINAGVDYTGHFDSQYALFLLHNDRSLSADGLEQQLGRVRHCKQGLQIYTDVAGELPLDDPEDNVARLLTMISCNQNFQDHPIKGSRLVEMRSTERFRRTATNPEALLFAAKIRYTVAASNQTVFLKLIAKQQRSGKDVFLNTFPGSRPLIKAVLKYKKLGTLKHTEEVLEGAVVAYDAITGISYKPSSSGLNTKRGILEANLELSKIIGSLADARKGTANYKSKYLLKKKYYSSSRTGELSSAISRLYKLDLVGTNEGKRLLMRSDSLLMRESGQAAPSHAPVYKRPVNSAATVLTELDFFTSLRELLTIYGFDFTQLRKLIRRASSKLEAPVFKGKQIHPTLWEFKAITASLKSTVAGVGDISDYVTEADHLVWELLKDNAALQSVFLANVNQGPEVHFSRYQKRIANGKSDAFVPWGLEIFRHLTKVLTSVTNNSTDVQRKRVGGKRVVVGYLLRPPYFNIAAHRTLRMLQGLQVETTKNMLQ